MKVNRKICSIVHPHSLPARLALKIRIKIYEKLENWIDLDAQKSILDVGVSPDSDAEYSNFFEAFYPYTERITAVSEQDAHNLCQVFPKLKFIQADGCSLPFPDNSFDFVFSSAVIEHIGSEERQKQFLSELSRVSRKYVFLTTPNRWHPFEFHTCLPLIHWLPKKAHRLLLRFLGLTYLSFEQNLNLLGKSDLLKLSQRVGVIAHIDYVRFLGCRSNLLLLIEKRK